MQKICAGIAIARPKVATSMAERLWVMPGNCEAKNFGVKELLGAYHRENEIVERENCLKKKLSNQFEIFTGNQWKPTIERPFG